MSNITLDELFPLLAREISARRKTLLGIFTAVALAFLALAMIWQNKYKSYVQLYVDDQRLVTPIVGAESTASRDQANVAREELFSNEIMDQVLLDVGFITADTPAVEREEIKEEVIDDTEVFNINNQLLEITFEHTSPKVAFDTASRYADLFLEKTMRSSAEESSDAFDFINAQVETYRDKLEDAERRLESFRARHPGVSATADSNIDQRVIELRRQLEEAQLQFASADQRRRSLERELSSESSTIAADYQASQIRQRIAELQSEIESLRLSYTDDYPDIQRLMQQIEDYRQMAEQSVAAARGSNGEKMFNLNGQTFSGAANLSPVYQQLRSDHARSSAEAASLNSKMGQLRVMLDNEEKRVAEASRVERELADLTRDYQFNQTTYADWLRKQENARLSMSLGAEQQGVLYRISQAAVYPYLPNGVRFVHIAILGLLLAIGLPFFYLAVFLKLDPRIRTGSAVTDVLELPLLATVPHMVQPNERRGLFARRGMIVAVVIGVVLLYCVAAYYKYSDALISQGVSLT